MLNFTSTIVLLSKTKNPNYWSQKHIYTYSHTNQTMDYLLLQVLPTFSTPKSPDTSSTQYPILTSSEHISFSYPRVPIFCNSINLIFTSQHTFFRYILNNINQYFHIHTPLLSPNIHKYMS